MPVVATVERRREFARRARVGVGQQHVRDLVGIVLVYAGQRERGEAGGGGFVERLGGVGRRPREDTGAQCE
jgi:hypothetical protein